MKIVIVSNYITHHTKFLCDELYKILGRQFTFVETKQAEDSADAFKRGYAYFMANAKSTEATWLIPGWQVREKAQQVIQNADAVIAANCTDDWILPRLKSRKLTFRAHERWYRKALQWYQFPRAIIGGWLHHGRYSSLYLLSASGYTAADAASVGCFRGKAYRWGYFPEFREYTQQQLKDAKHGDVPSILWAGRLVDWKRAEDAIVACKKLLCDGYKFRLNIAGTGPEKEILQKSAEEMGDVVQFLGLLSPDDLRDEMEKSNIFLFTSDFQEGWGVVLNEAMNSGCAVVASHAAGATPYLIKDSENGLVYSCGDCNALANQIRKLLDSPEWRFDMGVHAYRTIQKQWSPEQAAKRLICLCDSLLKGDSVLNVDGPCSIAPIIKNSWYQ